MHPTKPKISWIHHREDLKLQQTIGRVMSPAVATVVLWSPASTYSITKYWQIGSEEMLSYDKDFSFVDSGVVRIIIRVGLHIRYNKMVYPKCRMVLT